MEMTGADALLQTAEKAGIEICFANPGTTEIPLVQALDRSAQIRAVLCLFEGVCAGAADGYARMADKPALTLLHLGPGFANAIAYLHDAKRARSPVINLIGEHATWHLAADPPLHSDIESLAQPVSHFVRRNRGADYLAQDMADALTIAQTFPGQIASLILPNDYLASTTTVMAAPGQPVPPERTAPELIVQAAKQLQLQRPAALFLGGRALRQRGLRAAARIAAQVGCELICETFPTRLERGAGTPRLQRLPYFPEPGRALLAPFKFILLAGARPPVTFFGYPNTPSYFISPDQESFSLVSPEGAIEEALEDLADELGAPLHADQVETYVKAELPKGQLTPETFTAVLAALQPENAIIMEEGISSVAHYFNQSSSSFPHSYLSQSGGAIGLGMPCATGAALACPDRKVITIQSDGAALYTIQALWTQAREALDVVTLLCSNRRYQILEIELKRAGIEQIGSAARNLIGLDHPTIDWVSLAQGFGVSAQRVTTAESLTQALTQALSNAGPHFIEVIL